MKALPLRAVPPALEVQVPRILDAEILSPQALAFVAALAQEFATPLRELLAERSRRAPVLDFLPETASVRESAWRVAPFPPDLEQRLVEITGPPEAKMILNALNSGADVFMVDFEDAMSPTWSNVVSGQRHLRDAVRGTLAFDDSDTGKRYRLNERTATLMVRPRGLHLVESHVRHRGEFLPAALFDFGLAFFHNARVLLERGSGPYFYLPKLEHYLEARLWNQIFERAEELLELPRASVRATVLIETLPAAFQMDEILYELRDRSAGLNCGRWDYIFSSIKSRRHDPDAVFPDRAQVGMDQPFLRSYTQLAIKTCHRRGIHALGGMAAQIPNRRDPEANARSLAKVRADKEREAGDGHDGTWVAHPDLVPIAREAFRSRVRGPHQLQVARAEVNVSAQDLLAVPEGPRTREGLRWNVRVGIGYLESWLRGTGCVPLYGLMEDAATAEISRTQIWQWIRHGAVLDDGARVTPELLSDIVGSELARLEPSVLARGRFAEAQRLFTTVACDPDLPEFLTLPSYAVLCAIHDGEMDHVNTIG